MVSTPQTPTHGALAKFRTEVTISMQMLTSWASFKSEGHSLHVEELRSRLCCWACYQGHASKACGEGSLGRWQFYWHKVKPVLM